MRTLAIGDIHGCNAALTSLLKAVQPAREDQIIFLGDYIDRGPSSREVIETLLELEKLCSPNFLRGNHEVMILDARNDPRKSDLWQSYGGLETLFSYGANYKNDMVSIPDAHWAFLDKTQRFFETDTHIFVHACVDPSLDMADQPDWLLFWEFFERLEPHKSGKAIVCGHSPQRSGRIGDNGFALCIDTGAAYGGWLTCLDVSSGEYWQTKETGAVQEGQLKEQ
jgi:serine/threonine protein phosphatase 1